MRSPCGHRMAAEPNEDFQNGVGVPLASTRVYSFSDSEFAKGTGSALTAPSKCMCWVGWAELLGLKGWNVGTEERLGGSGDGMLASKSRVEC